MSTWIPATFNCVSGSMFVFTAEGMPVMRTFDSNADAVKAVSGLGMRFEFCAETNQARTPGGEAVALPQLATPQEFVRPTKCQLVLGGHRPHHLPALRAIREGEWEPVEVLTAEGQKITLATGDGLMEVYHHDPDAALEATAVSRRWSMLRAGQRLFMYSETPIGPCIA